MKTIIILSFVILLENCRVEAYADYYWRDYNGTIPADAIPVVKDHVYIAQTVGFSVDAYGDIPTGISPGDTTLFVPFTTVITKTSPIRILCSSQPHAFSWLPTSTKTFLDDTSGKTLILGGWQARFNYDNAPELYIGRTGNFVGKLDQNKDGNCELYYANDSTTERHSDDFDVLIYDSE